jgi:hypothetical protein
MSEDDKRLEELSGVFAAIGEVWSKPTNLKEKRKIDPAELHSRLVSASSAFVRDPQAASARSFLAEIDAAMVSGELEPNPVPASPTVTLTITVTITVTVRARQQGGGNPPEQ